MYAMWIGEDRYVGPSWKKTLAIKNGEVRKIHIKKGKQYILEGRNNKGYYGWIDGKYIKILKKEEGV